MALNSWVCRLTNSVMRRQQRIGIGTHRLILTEFDRELFELCLGRPVKEGEKILGAEVMFARPCEEATEEE